MITLIAGVALWWAAHLFKRLAPAARANLGEKGYGIMAVAIARFAGARHIVITDVNDYRLDLARQMGASVALNVTRDSISDTMQTLGMEDVWKGASDRDAAIDVLAQSGYPDGAAILQWLELFRDGPVTRYLGEQGRQWLDQLMPLLLNAAATAAQPAPLDRSLPHRAAAALPTVRLRPCHGSPAAQPSPGQSPGRAAA